MWDSFWSVWGNNFFVHIFEVWGLADLIGGIVVGGIIWFLEWSLHKFPNWGKKMKIPRKRGVAIGFIIGVLLVHLIIVIPYNIYKTDQLQIGTLQTANKTATQRISDLEFDRALVEQQLKGTTSNVPIPPILKLVEDWGETFDKIANPKYDPIRCSTGPRFVFPGRCCSPFPPELDSENSVLAIKCKFYVMYPVTIDSVSLSIGGKTLVTDPGFFDNKVRPEDLISFDSYWIYFKYKGIIKPGTYDNVTIIAIAENTTFISNPISVIVREPKIQE